MPEGILKFSLPDEQDAFKAAHKATEIINVFDEFKSQLEIRRRKSLTDIEREMLTSVIDILNGLTERYGIHF